MIRFFDSLRLASTKLRTRKIRTAFTVAISGLLFGLIIGVILVSDGVFASLEQMMSKSMSGRYIIAGSIPYEDNSTIFQDQLLVQKAEAEYQQLVNDKKAEAKRLGIEYDAGSEVKPVFINGNDKSLSIQSPIAVRLFDQAVQEKFNPPTMEDFKKSAAQYQPNAYYQSRTLVPKDGQVKEMKKGVESFGEQADDNTSRGTPNDIEEITLAPQGILTSYLLKDSKWNPESGHIPVVVSQKRAAALVGMDTFKKDTPTSERLNYIKMLLERSNGQTFTACYRNSVSSSQISQAVNANREIESKKNDKNYQKPAYLLGTPEADSCGEVTVLQDKRSAEEKSYISKQKQFEAKFGAITDPIQRKLTFEIVGVAPNGWQDADLGMSLGVKDLLTSLLMTQSFRFSIPEELFNQLPDRQSYDQIFSQQASGPQAMFSNGQFFAEFDSADQAKRFAKEQSCEYTGAGSCVPESKSFMMQPFGSNSIGINDAKVIVNTVVLWGLLIIGAIAALISGLTIGRAIADGRRETAVFRAIGFKKFDITQVYATYTLLLCLRVLIFAVVLGGGIAILVHSFFWLETTSEVRSVLGLYYDQTEFKYFGFTSKLVVAVLAIFGSGILGMLLPLLRNNRRNPISDMRDE